MAYYVTQPAPVPQMQVVSGGNRNALNKSFHSNGLREWSYGMCECFGDFGTACLACWFPCIVYSQNKSRLDHLRSRGYPHPGGGDACSCDGCIYCLLLSGGGWGCSCAWIVQMISRRSVRERYRIDGGQFGDCCVSFWCACCELTQESRELELEEQSIQPRA